MADELMTSQELQEYLRVDRTTLYAMLKAGELPGFKVGGRWRFSRSEVEAWLQEQHDPDDLFDAPVSPDVLPLSVVQSVQDIFAEAMGVGAVVTRLDGRLLTEPGNSCAFCDLVRNAPKGMARCVDSWRELANQKERRPRLFRCHAGLYYARSLIEVGDEYVAMAFAGQIVVDDDPAIVAKIDELEACCELDAGSLRAALPSIRAMGRDRVEVLMRLLARLGETLSHEGRERLLLLHKLRHIAQVTAL